MPRGRAAHYFFWDPLQLLRRLIPLRNANRREKMKRNPLMNSRGRGMLRYSSPGTDNIFLLYRVVPQSGSPVSREYFCLNRPTAVVERLDSRLVIGIAAIVIRLPLQQRHIELFCEFRGLQGLATWTSPKHLVGRFWQPPSTVWHTRHPYTSRWECASTSFSSVADCDDL